MDMGWLRLVGFLKLQVSFAKYRLFYRALLQKRPVILRGLLIIATPYACLASIRSERMAMHVSFAKETYTFKEPTDRSHPISVGSDRMDMDVSFISPPIKCEPTNRDRHVHTDTQSLTHTHTNTHKHLYKTNRHGKSERVQCEPSRP